MVAALAVVAVLTAAGVFSSIANFPLIFAGVCLVIGLVSLWRRRDRVRVAPWAALLLVGAALPVAGWWYRLEVVRGSQVRVEREVFAALRGTPAPALVGLEPLNTGAEELAAATSYAGPATLVAFWATWCSPCYAEMEELEALYREHRERGLSVVAVTRYDEASDERSRRETRERSAEFARRRGFTYPVAITGEISVYRGFRVNNIPRTALVDAGGKIVGYAAGLDGARRLMRQAAAMAEAAQRGAAPGSERAGGT